MTGSPVEPTGREAKPPDYLHAFDGGDWAYYVHGHDPDELHVIDDPEGLRWENLWMRPIKASECQDYGFPDDDSDDTVLRNPKTGRFEPRWCWVECGQTASGAEPFMGVGYKS